MTDLAASESAAPEMSPKTLLKVNNLVKEFPIRRGIFFKREIGSVKAVSDISFEIAQGETLGLVGESGCGKSTTARCVLRLLEPTSGEVIYHQDIGDSGTGSDEIIDIVTADKEQLRLLRREMQIVFQDPFASLNPWMTVASIVSEPLVVHGVDDKDERLDAVKKLLEVVGLNPEHAN